MTAPQPTTQTPFPTPPGKAEDNDWQMVPIPAGEGSDSKETFVCVTIPEINAVDSKTAECAASVLATLTVQENTDEFPEWLNVTRPPTDSSTPEAPLGEPSTLDQTSQSTTQIGIGPQPKKEFSASQAPNEATSSTQIRDSSMLKTTQKTRRSTAIDLTKSDLAFDWVNSTLLNHPTVSYEVSRGAGCINVSSSQKDGLKDLLESKLPKGFSMEIETTRIKNTRTISKRGKSKKGSKRDPKSNIVHTSFRYQSKINFNETEPSMNTL